jgi:hypothetical protein
VTDFGGDGVADFGGYRRDLPNSVKIFVPSQGPFGQYIGKAMGMTFGPDSARVVNAEAIVDGAFAAGSSNAVFRGLAAVVFSDENIRNGTQTYGWLDITAVANHPGEKRLTVHRLIFDDASTTAPTGLTSASTGIPEWQVSAVPEPGSNLALLALGAGGLTLRRRLKRAA